MGRMSGDDALCYSYRSAACLNFPLPQHWPLVFTGFENILLDHSPISVYCSGLLDSLQPSVFSNRDAIISSGLSYLFLSLACPILGIFISLPERHTSFNWLIIIGLL